MTSGPRSGLAVPKICIFIPSPRGLQERNCNQRAEYSNWHFGCTALEFTPSQIFVDGNKNFVQL